MPTTPRDAIDNGNNETTEARAAVDAIMERYADEIVDSFAQEKPPPRRRTKPPNRRQQIIQEAQARQARSTEKKTSTVEPISPLAGTQSPTIQDWPVSKPDPRPEPARLIPNSPKTWHDNWKATDNPIDAQDKKTAAAKEEAKKLVAERIENERQKKPADPRTPPPPKRKRFEPKEKVLVTTHMVKSGDVGYHGNLFGGTMLSWLDEAAGVLACQVADSSQMVTLKIEELLFLHPVRPGQIIKVYGSVDAIGKTSVRLNVEARSHRVQDGRQRKVVSTRMTFVRIDGAGDSMMINDTVREKWGFERLT